MSHSTVTHMSRKVKTIRDVVEWNLCMGCGACVAFCDKEKGVELVDIPTAGIRPSPGADCISCSRCLAVCPGVSVDAAEAIDDEPERIVQNFQVGNYHGLYEGYAADQDIRFTGSSGGILTALSVYALEKGGLDYVVHTGMDKSQPWKNKTVVSRNRRQLLDNAGSRYCTSSPCEFFNVIEKSEGRCVFIGKPCDVTALAKARRLRPQLDAKVGLALSFFCAGTPCSEAVSDLAGGLGVASDAISSLRFRGHGWPGHFEVQSTKGGEPETMSYLQSWKTLAKRRPFRCHICPDGMGLLSDITSGDAWNRYTGEAESDGISHVVVRTGRGRRVLERALEAGYVELTPSTADDIIEAQGIHLRRTVLFGRLIGMRLCGVPIPRYSNFGLFSSWLRTNPLVMASSIFGTLKRMVVRKLWKRSPYFYR